MPDQSSYNKERTLIAQTPEKVGQTITVKGWVNSKRDHGKITFIDLVDRSAKLQIVGFEKLSELTIGSVISATGLVKKRGERYINSDLETGEVELEVEEYQILNLSKELPITLDSDGREIGEVPRLKYRYLDLRRERMQHNIRLRSHFTRALRRALYEQDFVEIETPILTKSTKEGARDFIVPSRFQPGKFYALPQAPQQYKQLLMTAGFERYFQIARCIRDEDLRSDRGFEFTQLDLEMSFVDQEQVMTTVEETVKQAVKQVGGRLQQENFPVYSYQQALDQFGADKFDLRSEEDKQAGVLAFAWVVDFPFFKQVDQDDAAEVKDGKSGWTFTHNPFSRPQQESLKDHLAQENIGQILTCQYDLVCNGYEVGGGSIRAHDPQVLRTTFEIMGYSDQEIEDSIGHMLRAFELGTPPHGGIALGLDRLAMILTNEESLKEVVAFPMTSTGRTAVMDAPDRVSPEQLEELGLKVTAQDPPQSEEEQPRAKTETS
ncbi:MAG: aspartate--tRNA ligase [Candidatus Pacebacteria bacterium]|nr:aspartate--tRNA ligase [Candidatus Paceibacterota bacterium]